MKKISYLELSSLIIIILINFQTRINLSIIKEDIGVNSWIIILLSYILGIIPLLLTIYISKYKEDLNIYEKIKALFGNTIGNIINLFIITILFIIGITILYNISSFITTQFLYHTPVILSSILLIILIIYCTNKEINVISHVSIILMTINIIIFTISSFSIIQNIQIDNLLPIIRINSNKIITATLKITSINILPIISILVIPRNKITSNYNKTIIISYIIASLISLIMTIFTISVLGIYLVKLFEFPEYMVLKKIKLFGFLERIENIVSIMWITEAFIYITLIFYNISKCLTKNYYKLTNIITGILTIIIIKYLFKNIAIFNNYVKNTFIHITALLLIPYILISLKIMSTKKKD